MVVSMKNIFCVDLEDWYHQSLVPGNNTDFTPRVEENTDRLLEIFSDTDTKATFFVLGQIAARHPGLIKKIRDAGHELACHGYDHKLLYDLTPQQFREDTKKAADLIEDIAGVKVLGYRASSWSVNNSTLWALEILQELGFVYDASIFPVKNFLYGIPDAPRFAHPRGVGEGSFLEVPTSTFTFFDANMGFSGGFYFRALPAFMIKYFTREINKGGNPVIFYLHPVEIDKQAPKMKANIRDKIIMDWGIPGCERKLGSILKAYDFVTIKDYYNL